MIQIKEKNNPSFLLLPINNDRTGWKPFGYPVLLVVPNSRTLDGIQYVDSNRSVFNTRIYIEDTPRQILVAGHDNIGRRFPDRELYIEHISQLELIERQIDIDDFEVNETETGNKYFKYTTSTGLSADIEYNSTAIYYDLSDVLIETEPLQSGRYNLVYETEYFTRIVSNDVFESFLCVDKASTSVARLSREINHPGEVLDEFYKHTPPPYLSNSVKSADKTIEFYRPFTDSIQNIYDEQELLESINWVYKAPPEVIPYLSTILGWELPYFPESLDSLRKAVLRRTVEFQKFSGSRRSIINLFQLFGFDIYISSLWWSSDGERFIKPGEQLPVAYRDQEITIAEVPQVDLLLNDYQTDGFFNNSIPLLYRPQQVKKVGDEDLITDGGDITIESYLVDIGTEAYIRLKEISSNLLDNSDIARNYEYNVDVNGNINSNLLTSLDGLEVEGFSQITLNGLINNEPIETSIGNAPINKNGIEFNKETNEISIRLKRNFDFNNQAIFVFAIYKKQDIIVPDVIKNLQSNRFDVQIINRNSQEFADPVTLEFAIEFLYRIKAFHSLLNAIKTSLESTESYEVTDWCIGGDYPLRYDTDAGRLQVPPAILPSIPTTIEECTSYDAKELGYKDEDIKLRIDKINALNSEYTAWLALSDRKYATSELLKIMPNIPNECGYTIYGQAKTQQTRSIVKTNTGSPPDTINQLYSNIESFYSQDSANKNVSIYSSFNKEYTIDNTFCEDNTGEDYCYKGRVNDELLYKSQITNTESFRIKICDLGQGHGSYYTYPAYSKMILKGTKSPSLNSRTLRPKFSGRSLEGNVKHFEINLIKQNDLDISNNNFMGKLYRSYGSSDSQTLHYAADSGLPNPDQRHNLALQRPELGIEKATMHLPGCKFPTFSKLENDYTSSYNFRPWDFEQCGICYKNDPLNTTVVIDSNGDEKLSFDSVQYVVYGNGFPSDIGTYGSHDVTNGNASEVIHKVYSKGSSDSLYVTLDQVCDYDETDSISIIENPLFGSHSLCGSGDVVDFLDGYACDVGQFSVNPETWVYESVLIDLGMPVASSDVDLLFKFNSGIYDENVANHRMDCGCNVSTCDLTVDEDIVCSSDSFVDQNGDLDWNPDHLELHKRLVFEESFSVFDIRHDGEIPSFLEL